MAITISGENNNDRILASDGVIDEISGINIVGLLTAGHINVGNNIQLGNAGIITATTFIGNVTGNVNSTSPLLLQTDGGERFRITGNNELGIAGGNYGSAGQVLTSGGSGNPVSWTTIAAQANISNNADNRVITGGSGVNLNGEANLTFDGSLLNVAGRITCDVNSDIDMSNGADGQIQIGGSGYTSAIALNDEGMQIYHNSSSRGIIFGINESEKLRIDSSGKIKLGSGGNVVGSANVEIRYDNPVLLIRDTAESSTDGDAKIAFGNNTHYPTAYISHIWDGNEGSMTFHTRDGGTEAERLRIDSSGRVLINNVGNATPGLSVNADDLVIGYGTQSGETGITMFSTAGSGIRFNDNSGTDGAIEYAHAARQLRFNAGNVVRFNIAVGGPSSNSSVFNMGATSSDQNNMNQGDRSSVKVGDYLHLESPTGGGHNSRAGLGYNCYFGGNENFYSATNAPNSGDNRAAAYGMAYGNHYFYGDASNTAHSPQAQLTMTRNMVIHRQGYVTKPAQPSFHARLINHKNATQNPLIFDDVIVNVGSHYKSSGSDAGKFVVPIAGTYFFFWEAIKNSTSSVTRLYLMKNGVKTYNNMHLRLQEEGLYANGCINAIMTLAAGDKIHINLTIGGVHAAEYTHFGGYLIG